MRWLVLVAIMFGAVISSFGGTNSHGIAAVTAVVLVLGTVVTGAGPHSGDKNAADGAAVAMIRGDWGEIVGASGRTVRARGCTFPLADSLTERVIESALAYFLALQLGVGTPGVYAAISIAESAIAIAGIIIFRQGKWKTVRI